MLNLIFDIRWFSQAVEREAEGGDDRWEIEDCHLSDVPGGYGPLEGDDLNPEGPIKARRFADAIEDKGRLCIGTCRIQTPLLLRPRAKYCGGENRANRFSPRYHEGKGGIFNVASSFSSA